MTVDRRSPHLYLSRPLGTQPNLPLFIYLPGMDGSGELLHRQMQVLSKTFDMRCLVIPKSDRSDWDTLADQVLQLMHNERSRARYAPWRERPIYLCGESFGGCLALWIAQKDPKAFDQLIVVNPAVAIHRRSWIDRLAMVTGLLPRLVYTTACVNALPLLAELPYVEPEDRRSLLSAMQSIPQEAVAWRMLMLAQFRLIPDALMQVNCPTLLIASRGDRLLPSYTEAHLLAQLLPQASIHVLPHSGHACLLEKEVNLYRILEANQFLPPTKPLNQPSPDRTKAIATQHGDRH
jgi:pimeloyl-ACP methyl ester carboxylesterase